MKNISRNLLRGFLLTSALCLLTSAPAARAGQQTQTDTNVLSAASTNTYKISADSSGTFTNGQTFPDAQTIDGTKTTQMFCTVGGFFTNSGAGSSNITFRIAGSVDGANWTNNAQTVVLSVPVATNWASAQFAITAPYPQYSLRATENVNTGNVAARGSTIFFKVYTKNGL